MNFRFLPWFLGTLAIVAQAEELAPASSQYLQEGQTKAIQTPPPASPPARSPAPKLFSRKIWPKVELSDGRILEKARVTAESASTVTLTHSMGMTKVDKRALPEAMAVEYPYDEAGAEAEALQAEEQKRKGAEAAEIAAEQAAKRAQKQQDYLDRNAKFDPNLRRLKKAKEDPTVAEPHGPEAIDAAVREKALAYFESEKRTGSGSTLVFTVFLETDEPTEIAGWPNQWAVTGTASYKVYDSYGGGAFSNRSGKKFRATVEAVPGKKIKVLKFEER